jgi:hypothetical protein
MSGPIAQFRAMLHPDEIQMRGKLISTDAEDKGQNTGGLVARWPRPALAGWMIEIWRRQAGEF